MPGPLAADRRDDLPADLRLVGPALAVWTGAFAGTSGRPLPAALASAGLLAATAVVGPRHLPRRAALAVAACLLGGLGVGLLHAAALRLGPVDDLAEGQATAEVSAVVIADPTRVPPQVWGDRRTESLVLVRVRAHLVTARGNRWSVRSPLLVLARDRGWRGLLPGERVTAVGRLGPARPGQAVSAVLAVSGPPRSRTEASALQRAAGTLRAGLRRASADLPPAERGLLPGLVVGDTSRVPARVTEDFRTAGLTHLTAVSGANLAIVTGFVLLVGRRAGVRGRALPLLAGLAMAGFVVLARPQPSVVRAAAMGTVALLAMATGRRRESITALAAAVVVLLLLDPWLARSYGFVLSVLATGGLVLLAPRWARAWRARGVPRPLALAVAVPMAAQVTCAPVVALLSGQVSVVAVLANLLVAPAIAPATVLGVLATVASVVHPGAARLLAETAGVFVRWVAEVAERSASVPWAAVGWPGTLGGALALAAATVGVIWLVARWGRTARPAAFCGGLAAAVVLAATVAARPSWLPGGWPPDRWVLAACDVGQGDALVLAAGPGTAVVVDTGPEPRAIDRCLRRLEVRRVPVVVLSHLHADHVEGLPGVLRGRWVGEVQVGAHDEPAEELARVRRWTEGAGVPLTRATVGDRVRVGPLSWEVVWPARVIQAGSVPNNASTVVLARSRGVRMLLTGDVEPEAQRALLTAGRPLGPVDVLKVAHHGSAYQAIELLAAVRPRAALVSVGADNDYGHPAPGTLRQLHRSGALVGRTDRDGTLVVVGPRADLRLVRAGR